MLAVFLRRFSSVSSKMGFCLHIPLTFQVAVRKMILRQKEFNPMWLIAVVLGLVVVAIIAVPRMRDSQPRQANESQLASDHDTMRAALEVFRARSTSGQTEPILGEETFTAETLTFRLLDVEALVGLHESFKNVPGHIMNAEVATGTLGSLQDRVNSLDYRRGQVVAGVRMEGTVSTSLIHLISGAGPGVSNPVARIVR